MNAVLHSGNQQQTETGIIAPLGMKKPISQRQTNVQTRREPRRVRKPRMTPAYTGTVSIPEAAESWVAVSIS
jgi:hypothetical protein